MSKIFFIVLIIPIFTASPVFPSVLSNSSILVDVDGSSGRVFFSTVNGRDDIEGDENSDLLFYDEPPSSYTIVYVDDELFVFGSVQGEFSLPPTNRNGSVETVWENDLVRVKQVVLFARGKDSGREEGLLVKYRVENKSKTRHSIGLRLLFDTCLGEKGKYHFQLFDGSKIEFETTLEKENLSAGWRSLSEKIPGLCLSGITKGNIVTVPDKINFANYKTLQDNPEYNWVVPKTKQKRRFDNLPFSKSDSAVALYFKPSPVVPGGVLEYKTVLGLCGSEDYTLEVPETIVKEEIVKEIEKSASDLTQTPVKKAKLSAAELVGIKKELEAIGLVRGSLDDINRILKRINEVLASEGKQIQEDELVDILDTLKKEKK